MRVKQRTSESFKTVSNITHIRRPRDGEWECIESVFDKKKVSKPYKLTIEEVARQLGIGESSS